MKLLSIVIFCLFALPAFALDVVFLSPNDGTSVFWLRVNKLTMGVAEDLAINLRIVNYDNHHTAQIKHINDILTAENKPDFVIFTPYKESIIYCFDALEKAQIPFVTLERVFGLEKLAEVGLPQVKYKYWLGEMFHDNVAASYLLSDSLIKTALNKLKAKENYVAIAITGDKFSGNVYRWHGLRENVKNHPNVYIARVISANWKRKLAASKYAILLDKLGEIDIVWSASDSMALGVVDWANKNNLVVNRDFVIGGFDWLPEALTAIKNGTLTASVGGHFLQGAWALILFELNTF